MSSYSVYVTPDAWREIKDAPGVVRQRLRRAIDGLESEPRQSNGRPLDLSELAPDLSADQQVWRLRLDNWRVVYLVNDMEKTVDVLAVRRRPPYDYGDLSRLLSEID